METSTCCSVPTKQTNQAVSEPNLCPVSGHKGKSVKLITLKSLLTPQALTTLDAQGDYYFCKEASCGVVYFGAGLSYGINDLKVKVHQKDTGAEVPVCYCFDWTPNTIAQAANVGKAEDIPASISAHIKAGRCGCEVNNPQGSCCLGNVNAVVKATLKDELSL